MSAFKDISVALNKKIQAYSVANTRPVAYENIEYEPIVGTMYLRPTLLPAKSSQAGLGTAGQERHEGIYQIDVFAPSNKPLVVALTEADAIANYFTRGLTLTYNAVNVRVNTASQGRANRDGAWFVIPVFIDYLSYTTARTA